MPGQVSSFENGAVATQHTARSTYGAPGCCGHLAGEHSQTRTGVSACRPTPEQSMVCARRRGLACPLCFQILHSCTTRARGEAVRDGSRAARPCRTTLRCPSDSHSGFTPRAPATGCESELGQGAGHVNLAAWLCDRHPDPTSRIQPAAIRRRAAWRDWLCSEKPRAAWFIELDCD